jgi:lysozyme
MHKTLSDQLIEHEGERLKPYKCTAGYLTVGCGRNLEGKGITLDESRYLLQNDINECVDDLLRIFPGFYLFAEQRRWALIDMRFNLGPSRFRGFRRMIAAIIRDDWEEAANEALDSTWARQVQKSRVDKILKQLREG